MSLYLIKLEIELDLILQKFMHVIMLMEIIIVQ